MSIIKQTMAKNIVGWIEYTETPGVEGFQIQLQFISKEDLIKIRNKCLERKRSRSTRQMEETVNNDKFLELYAEKTILDWKGLKVKHLPKLIPSVISGMNPEQEVPFDLEDAVELLKNSKDFDDFISLTLNDFEEFMKNKRDENVKN